MIALVLGDATNGVVATMTKVYKRREIEGFSTLSELLHALQVQKKTYNRVICNTLGVHNEALLTALHQHLVETNSRTEVVFIARVGKGHELNMVEIFHRIYLAGIYTDVIINKSTDVEFVYELCFEPIDNLRNAYSSRKDEKIQTNAEYVVEEDESDLEIVRKAPHCLVEGSGVLKTFGYGGKFFGRRELNKHEKQAVRVLMREAEAVSMIKR
jgi:hypothetical protein